MITFKEHKRLGCVKYQGSVMTLNEALLRTPERTKILLQRKSVSTDEILLHIRNGKYKILRK